MDNLWMNFDDTRTRWRPGQTLSGRVGWQIDRTPKTAEVRLFWYTSGIGTQDVEVIAAEAFDQPRPNDERRFSFTLPEGPYSFAGKLVALNWAVELVLNPGGATQRVEIELTPFDAPVALERIELPRKNGFRIGTS